MAGMASGIGVLGLHVRGDRLSATPLLPANWELFELSYCFGKTLDRISVNQSARDGVQRVVLDGVPQANAEIHLIDDGREHSVEIEIFADSRSMIRRRLWPLKCVKAIALGIKEYIT